MDENPCHPYPTGRAASGWWESVSTLDGTILAKALKLWPGKDLNFSDPIPDLWLVLAGGEVGGPKHLAGLLAERIPSRGDAPLGEGTAIGQALDWEHAWLCDQHGRGVLSVTCIHLRGFSCAGVKNRSFGP